MEAWVVRCPLFESGHCQTITTNTDNMCIRVISIVLDNPNVGVPAL